MTPLEGLNADFRDVLVALAESGAEFMLVGAYSLAFHGVPRATGDIDVLVRPTRDNARLVHAALIAFGAPLEAAGVTPEDFANAGTVYQIGLPPRRIDILTQISGVTFEEAWGSRVEAELSGHAVPVIGRDALLKNKRSTGRTRDLADVEALEE